jgi:hypothetical protein
LQSRALWALVIGGVVVGLLVGGMVSGAFNVGGGDAAIGRPVIGGPPGLRLAESNVTVLPRAAVTADPGDAVEGLPAEAEPLSTTEVGLGPLSGSPSGPAAGTLESMECRGQRLLRTVAEGSAYFIEIAPNAPWNCAELLARWRPLSGAGQRIGIRYEEGSEGRPGYVTLFGEAGSLLFAANGLWVIS